MSLSKSQTNENNYRRDSFSDMVCDDLSEVILQYLSLEDKLRHECVSKQFQRNICAKHFVLIFDFNNNKTRVINLENLLRKFANIRQITIRCNSYYYSIVRNIESKYNKVIDLIIKYCNNLTHFNLIWYDMSEDNAKLFNEKFGPKLISVDLTYLGKINKNSVKLLKVSNIQELIIPNLEYELSSIKFNRLKRLKVVRNIMDEEMNNLEQFVETNGKTIKHLSIGTAINVTANKKLFMILSKLSNLVHLCLIGCNSQPNGIICKFNDKSLIKEVTQMAPNCNQLKSIECNYNLVLNEDKQIEDLLSPLRQFKRLKRLRLKFLTDFETKPYSDSDSDSEQDFREIAKLFSFKAFKGFENLTHLSLDFGYTYYKILSGSIFTRIDTYLPNLTHLVLEVYIYVLIYRRLKS